jgi:hypothetical protein
MILSHGNPNSDSLLEFCGSGERLTAPETGISWSRDVRNATMQRPHLELRAQCRLARGPGPPSKLLSLSRPLQVADEVGLAGHFGLELACHFAVHEFINEPELGLPGAGGGEEYSHARPGRGDNVIDDVPFIVEVDRSPGMRGGLRVNVEQITVLTVEVLRALAVGRAGAARENVIAQIELEGVVGRALRLSRTAGGPGSPSAEEKAKACPGIGLRVSLNSRLRREDGGRKSRQGDNESKNLFQNKTPEE